MKVVKSYHTSKKCFIINDKKKKINKNRPETMKYLYGCENRIVSNTGNLF